MVGGAVRDFLLKEDTEDFDFATNATPEEIIEVLSDSGHRFTEVGIEFGTIAVHIEDHTLRITTYRRDEYDKKSRKQEVVKVNELYEDLSRRDFTINAIAYDPIKNSIEDPFGGVKDLPLGKLKTPRDPSDSFSDDPLRMLSAVRFASQLEFKIDSKTAESIKRNKDRIEIVSQERITAELF